MSLHASAPVAMATTAMRTRCGRSDPASSVPRERVEWGPMCRLRTFGNCRCAGDLGSEWRRRQSEGERATRMRGHRGSANVSNGARRVKVAAHAGLTDPRAWDLFEPTDLSHPGPEGLCGATCGVSW